MDVFVDTTEQLLDVLHASLAFAGGVALEIGEDTRLIDHALSDRIEVILLLVVGAQVIEESGEGL